MDDKEYRKIYNYLKEISEFEADIYSSESYEELLAEADIEVSQKSFEDALRMQLAEESFESICSDILHAEPMTMKQQQIVFVCQLLKEKLEFYSESEKHVLQVEMIKKLEEWNEPMLEEEVFEVPQQSSEYLETRLAEGITDISFQMLEQSKIQNWEITTIDMGASCTTVDFSAGASSGAIYLLDEKMRAYPEVIGTLTGVTAIILGVQKERKQEHNIVFTGNVLCMFATYIVTTVLWSYVLGTIVFQEDSSLKRKFISQKDKLFRFFNYCVQLFHTKMKAFQLSNLVEKAISLIVNICKNNEADVCLENKVDSSVENTYKSDEANVYAEN